MKNLRLLRAFFSKTFLSFIFLGLIQYQAFALVITEDFSTTTNKDSATAVWNQALGFVHPTLEIDFQKVGPINLNQAVSVSDGSEGAFSLATYANFGSVVGFDITIDASIHPILKVTSFTLDSGYTLTSINGPLVIHSLSTVLINGTIQCSGQAGNAAVGATGGAGGLGRCGGFAGGAGGNAGANGQAGLQPAALPAGRGNGGFTGATGGGGGGGCSFSNDALVAGTSAGGAGGASGTCVNDAELLNVVGSAGGGGGGSSGAEGGGGGGAGGGVVVIHAVGNITISTTGIILAKGGAGGGANTGGSGGAGGGGTIKLHTPGAISLEGPFGAGGSCADAVGATSPLPGAGVGRGANSSTGRTWLASPSITGASFEDPGTLLLTAGNPKYVITAQKVTTKSLDTRNSSPTFNSIASSPVTGDVSFEVAGSNDNFATDDTGWLNSTLLSSLNTKRYVKFRMTLTNSNATTPTQITSVSVDYTSAFKEDFIFKSGCGLIKNNSPKNPLNLFLVIFSLMMIPIALTYKLRLKSVDTK